MPAVFSAQVFFIVFRECLEGAVILSVLLAFARQLMAPTSDENKMRYRQMRTSIVVGATLGLLVCMMIGGVFIGLFYGFGRDLWSKSEDLWEGILGMIAAVTITVMGLGMLRLNLLQEKWRSKFGKKMACITEDREEIEMISLPSSSHTTILRPVTVLEPVQNNNQKTTELDYISGSNPDKTHPVGGRHSVKKSIRLRYQAFMNKYSLGVLPFLTTLREGIEGVVFVGGVSLQTPATAYPLSVITGILAGAAVGIALYRGGLNLSIRVFVTVSTCILYLTAAGIFSRSVWFFENYAFIRKVGQDVSEMGVGPGSYDISNSVWHVNCCNPQFGKGWQVFNSLLGWQNSATYGSVISYNLYWLAVVVSVICLAIVERHYDGKFANVLRKFTTNKPSGTLKRLQFRHYGHRTTPSAQLLVRA